MYLKAEVIISGFGFLFYIVELGLGISICIFLGVGYIVILDKFGVWVRGYNTVIRVIFL